MEFKVEDHIIFLTLHGSHAYGMSTRESDIDVKGIAIPPKIYFYSFFRNFEQFEGQLKLNTNLLKNTEKLIGRPILPNEKIDSAVYNLKKFCKLAAECNPNIIEVLFTNEKHHLITTDLWKMILDKRDLFLSTKAKFTFCGYAYSQLKRIKTHRAWVLNPIKNKPTRKEFGLPEHSLISADHRSAAESLIRKKVEEWILIPDELPREVLESVRLNTINALVEMWEGLAADCKSIPIDDEMNYDINKLLNAAGKLLGYDTNFLELLDHERRYRSAIKQYSQYREWKTNRNPIRAAMEAKFGYDGKHASHLVRLLKMAEEILLTGKVNVYRDDAEELLSIRSGAWKFDDLLEWAKLQQEKLDKIYEEKISPLPKTPDYQKLDKLLMEVIEKSFGGIK